MKMLHLRVADLDMENAKEFEKLAAGLPGVLAVDIWTGRAELAISRPEAADDISRAIKQAGFRVTESIVCDQEDAPAVAGVMKVAVEGMTCRSCEITVERRLRKIPGVKRVDVDLVAGSAVIAAEAGADLNIDDLSAALKGEKYRLSPWSADRHGAASAEDRPGFWELTAYFALAAVVAWMLSRSRLSTDSWVSEAGGFWAAALVGLVAGASSCMAVSGGLLLSSMARFNQRYASVAALGRMRPVLLFVGGRVISYGVFGGLIGLIGRALVPSVTATGILLMIAAAFMLIMGLDMLKLAPRWLKRLLPATPKSVAHKVMDIEAKDYWLAPFLLGAATFFIPCGFTQAFQVYALSTHSFLAGMAVLGGFAVGTVPALLVLGLASSALNGPAGRVFLRFAGALVVVLGLMNLGNALTLTGLSLRLPGGPAKQMVNQAPIEGLPPVVDGRQVIKMIVGGPGAAYEPDTFKVRAGMPVRWEIDQKTSSGCLAYVVSRKLGISAPLKMGVNIVEFTPSAPGSYTFSCSMGMFSGTIDVVNAQ